MVRFLQPVCGFLSKDIRNKNPRKKETTQEFKYPSLSKDCQQRQGKR